MDVRNCTLAPGDERNVNGALEVKEDVPFVKRVKQDVDIGKVGK